MPASEQPAIDSKVNQKQPNWKPVHHFWPGNNRFWWGGKFVSGPWEDLSAQCLVGLFVLGVSYLYYTRVVRTFPAFYRLIGEIVFGGLLGLVVLAYFKVHLADPGIIPRKYFFQVPGLINRSDLEIDILLNGEDSLDSPELKSDEESKEKQALSKTSSTEESGILEGQPILKGSQSPASPSLSTLREPRLRRQRSRGQDKTGSGRVFCPICRIYRPIKAAHCSVCDNCVEVHAYHITFMGNCIGKRNFKYFISFLVATMAFLANFLVQFCIHYSHKKKQEDEVDITVDETGSNNNRATQSSHLAIAGISSLTDFREGFRLLSLLVFGLFGVLIVVGVLIYLGVLLYFVIK
jgi:DHHC palmitoyltransferase